jgi:hypothetical protein
VATGEYALSTKPVNGLVEAAGGKILLRAIARYGRIDLLCTDELGHMEPDRRGPEVPFQDLTEQDGKL